jgi:hypothetical protein
VAQGVRLLPLGPLVHIHRLTSAPGRGLTTVRPDGHIGLRGQIAEAGQLLAWLARAGLRLPAPDTVSAGRWTG